MRLTASNIVKAISRLPQGRWYDYIGPNAAPTKVRVKSFVDPEGPIVIERQCDGNISPASISTQMLWRIANACSPNVPFNFDRVLGGSYNTRSALEALMAHTPEFYWCMPGRIEVLNSSTKIQAGHKHLIWRPGTPHENGVAQKFETDQVISEVAQVSVYEALSVSDKTGLDIEVARRHLQIQIALIKIGEQLGFRTWIAHNDKGLKYGDKKIGELDGVVMRLEDEALIAPHQGAQAAALQIDCIWFKNGRFMPAVMEVEHTTGVTSGLSRMKNLQDRLPRFQTRWVIVAPDEDRHKVITEASKPQFSSLNTKFMPYSAVDELYGLCQRRKITGKAVNEEFLDCFMENCLQVQGNA